MARLNGIGVHGILADDKVELQHVIGTRDGFYVLHLPGKVTLYFGDGDNDSEECLLGFLDTINGIRSALLQDIADRTDSPNWPRDGVVL